MKLLLLTALVAVAYAGCNCDRAADACESAGKTAVDAKCTAAVKDKATCEAADDSQTTAVKCVWKKKWTGTEADCALSAKKAAGVARGHATTGSCRSGGADGKTFVAATATEDVKCDATAAKANKAACILVDDSQTTAKKCVWTATPCKYTAEITAAMVQGRTARKDNQATPAVCVFGAVGATQAAVPAAATCTGTSTGTAACNTVTSPTSTNCGAGTTAGCVYTAIGGTTAASAATCTSAVTANNASCAWPTALTVAEHTSANCITNDDAVGPAAAANCNCGATASGATATYKTKADCEWATAAVAADVKRMDTAATPKQCVWTKGTTAPASTAAISIFALVAAYLL